MQAYLWESDIFFWKWYCRLLWIEDVHKLLYLTAGYIPPLPSALCPCKSDNNPHFACGYVQQDLCTDMPVRLRGMGIGSVYLVFPGSKICVRFPFYQFLPYIFKKVKYYKDSIRGCPNTFQVFTVNPIYTLVYLFLIKFTNH